MFCASVNKELYVKECLYFWWSIAKNAWICLFIGWSMVIYPGTEIY